MGFAKRELERRDHVQAVAVDVAVKAGAIQRCEFHEEITVGQGDPDANSRAYAIGTNMLKAGEIDAERKEFMDAIKTAIEESGYECPRCVKWREE